MKLSDIQTRENDGPITLQPLELRYSHEENFDQSEDYTVLPDGNDFICIGICHSRNLFP